jgi:hypothetical protein
MTATTMMKMTTTMMTMATTTTMMATSMTTTMMAMTTMTMMMAMTTATMRWVVRYLGGGRPRNLVQQVHANASFHVRPEQQLCLRHELDLAVQS